MRAETINRKRYATRNFTVSDVLWPCGGLARRSVRVWRGPDPWEQIVEPVLGPAVDQAGEHVGDVGLRVDVVELASFDK